MTKDLNPAAVESVAATFHETYERLAVEVGYPTMPETAVPWDKLPESAKSLMLAVAREIMSRGWSFEPPEAHK